MDKEKQTIKKIKQLVPEIIELKMGCKIKNVYIFNEVLKRYEEYPDGIVIKDLRNEMLSLEISAGNQLDYSIRVDDKFKFEILGHDITLEDILVAIHQIGRTNAYCGECDCCIEDNLILKKWQFNKPFQDQSQETKNYIGDLLLK